MHKNIPLVVGITILFLGLAKGCPCLQELKNGYSFDRGLKL